MMQFLEGASGGHESTFAAGPMAEMIGGIPMGARLGAFTVESNQGHIGDAIDPKGGEDPTIYGHRASAEVARLSKFVAAQVYGAPPHHSYVWGGSGGGRRSPLCLEYGPDAWDAALPFVGGNSIVEHGSTERSRPGQTFGTMFNCQRILGDKVDQVFDATLPGGSGDPFAGLTAHQRVELPALYRLGFPRGDEFMIGRPLGQIWLWTSVADECRLPAAWDQVAAGFASGMGPPLLPVMGPP
jgi:Tannase and feruloyl esterase